MTSKLSIRESSPKFYKNKNLLNTSGVGFQKKDSTEFCLSELNETMKLCLQQNPIYNWSDRDNGGFWKRTWEFISWGFKPSQSGNLLQCYRTSFTGFKSCVNTDVSATTKISDYIDSWLIPHKMGNCSGIVVPNTKAKKILGCDGKTQNNIVNPRYNLSKGKVMNCDTDLPTSQWCACPGYPTPGSESVYDEDLFKCVCKNASEVPHFHYVHSLRGSDGRPISCCGPSCDYGYEYDCIDRACKPSLYTFES